MITMLRLVSSVIRDAFHYYGEPGEIHALDRSASWEMGDSTFVASHSRNTDGTIYGYAWARYRQKGNVPELEDEGRETSEVGLNRAIAEFLEGAM